MSEPIFVLPTGPTDPVLMSEWERVYEAIRPDAKFMPYERKLKPGGTGHNKVPLVDKEIGFVSGKDSATRSREMLAAAAAKYPGACLGAVFAWTHCLDLDLSANGSIPGWERWQQLAAAAEIDAEACAGFSMSGARHVWLRGMRDDGLSRKTKPWPGAEWLPADQQFIALTHSDEAALSSKLPRVPDTLAELVLPKEDRPAITQAAAAGHQTPDMPAAKLLQERIAELAATKPGARDDVLNNVCYLMGRLRGAGRLPDELRTESIAGIRDACAKNGYAAEEGNGKVDEKISRAGADGERNPLPQASGVPAGSELRPEKGGIGAPDAAEIMAPDLASSVMWVPGRTWYTRASEHSLWKPADDEPVHLKILSHPVARSVARGTRTKVIAEELKNHLHVPADELDSNDWEAGLPDEAGVLDLRTGNVRQAVAEDRITMTLGTAPEPGEPTIWFQTLADTFSKSEDIGAMLKYLRWWFWRALTGEIRDVCSAMFLFGPKGCGKSTVADTLAYVAGKYSTTVPSRNICGEANHHRQWLAGLAGKRFVRIPEVQRNVPWRDEDLNSVIDGMGEISANFMHKNSFTFKSKATLCFTGNHAPVASGASGIWRRLRLADCRNRVKDTKQEDGDLPSKLESEAGKILHWALGAASEPAPPVPAEMESMTDAVAAEADPLIEWLHETYVEDPSGATTPESMWDDYQALATRDQDVTLTKFGTTCTELFGKVSRPRIAGQRANIRRCSKR